jgi:hypothetical protein
VRGATAVHISHSLKKGHQTTKGMGTGAWFLMGLENSNPRRRARGTRSIRIFFGCAGS